MKQLVIPAIAVLFFGCGAAVETTSSGDNAAGAAMASASGDAAPEESSGANGAVDESFFDSMAFDERKTFMKDVVMPGMKPLFVEEHPDFSCVSCHGDDMISVNYVMPNTLDPLNPAAMPFESEDEQMRSMAMFMKNKVVPEMAGLLRKSPYNPETQSGFGCFNCHATASN